MADEKSKLGLAILGAGIVGGLAALFGGGPKKPATKPVSGWGPPPKPRGNCNCGR